MFYSFIIPQYNRPDEINELLNSLSKQTLKSFEVIVVEDGSKITSEVVVKSYQNKLDVKYFFKENSGQGFTRNYGFEKARGDFFIVLDSDVIVPPHYMQIVDEQIKENQLDAFGGPDTAAPNFTLVQKAISYSMTSFFTTGGIRGRKTHIGQYHPRSFNMGLSRKVWEITKGFRITRMGEDIDLSIRIIQAGFKTGLIEKAFVYHKRRTDFSRFYNQAKFFGRARINIYTMFPDQLKLIHFFPAVFVVFCFLTAFMFLFSMKIFIAFASLLIIYMLLILTDSTIRNRSLSLGILSLIASFVQLSGYGVGFIQEFWKRIILKKGNDVKKYPQ